MAGRMSSEFAQLLEQRKLFRSRIAREMIKKEIRAAETRTRFVEPTISLKQFTPRTLTSTTIPYTPGILQYCTANGSGKCSPYPQVGRDDSDSLLVMYTVLSTSERWGCQVSMKV